MVRCLLANLSNLRQARINVQCQQQAGISFFTWFTAEPATMMGRPLLPPAPGGRSSITATPSPRPYPSAATSNVRQRPDAERACSWQMAAVVPASCMRFTPATNAAPHSPSSKPWDSQL